MEKREKRAGFKISQVSFEDLKYKYGEQEAQKIWDNLQQSSHLLDIPRSTNPNPEKELPFFMTK